MVAIVDSNVAAAIDPLSRTRVLLESLMGPEGIYASDSPNYDQAYFGRDSIEAAEDVLEDMPELALLVIRLLCSVQGSRFDSVSEEEPGKIMHELRRLIMNGRPVGIRQRQILAELAVKWGGTAREVLYFGSIDAACRFARLLCRCCVKYGKEILFERVPVLHRPAESKQILTCLIDTVSWIERAIIKSDIGLLEFCRSNVYGHRFQVWQDGATAYIHADGSLPNARRPMAEVAVQGLAFDALVESASLLQSCFPTMAKRWFRLARQLQQRMVHLFWLQEEAFLAPLIDRDRQGELRTVRVLKASAGEVLETGILDSLPDALRDHIVGGITNRLFSDEFLTPFGLRTRSLRWAHLLPYADYQGSLVTWPKQSFDVSRGCRRHGLENHAQLLEECILRSVCRSGAHLEFAYVGVDDRFGFAATYADDVMADVIPGTNIPECNQAWTLSAVHNIVSRSGRRCPIEHSPGAPMRVDVPTGRLAEAAFMRCAA